MEYANLSSFERLTGHGFFTATGVAGAIDLGNIEMLKLDYQPKTVEIPLASRGNLKLARRDTYQVSPIYSIDGDQFATPVIPLLLLGTQGTDFSQSAGTGGTFTLTAVLGQAFWIGAYNVSLTTVKVSTVTKTINVDFFFDPFTGMISFPVAAAGINTGDTVIVTFDQPALTMEQYTAFTTLNRKGTLVVHAEDEYGPPSKEIWTMTVQLTMKTAPERDPSKFSKFTLEASIFGTPTVQKRKN